MAAFGGHSSRRRLYCAALPDGQGNGWASKNAHMTVFALIAVVWGPRRLVNELGSRGPPGHSWPSPAIV
jgi:hypothetical protein